jgi:hypothetical protein
MQLHHSAPMWSCTGRYYITIAHLWGAVQAKLLHQNAPIGGWQYYSTTAHRGAVRGDSTAPQRTYGELYRRYYCTTTHGGLVILLQHSAPTGSCTGRYYCSTAHLWGAVQCDNTAQQLTYGELYRAILLHHSAPMGSCTGRYYWSVYKLAFRRNVQPSSSDAKISRA